MKRTIIFLLVASTLSSCLTGGFDENPQLDDMNDQLALTPQFKSVKVNGTEIQRNATSRRVVDAHGGDVLNIALELTGGASADLEEIELFRVYYFGEDYQEPPRPMEGGTDGFFELSGRTTVFEYAYTVPEEDDDGFHFEPGHIIQLNFRAKNSLENFGFRTLEVRFTEE